METHNPFEDSKILYDLFMSFKKKPDKQKIDKIIPILENNALTINSILVFDYSLMHVKQGKDTMKYLIDLKGDVNNKNIKGITPIFLQEEYDTIKLLVENGGHPVIQDDKDFTPLFWQKDPQAMEYLLHKGLKINHFNERYNVSQWSPINDIYVEMFIIGGYDPYSENNICISPLFLQRNIKTQKIMLEHEILYNRYYHVDYFFETPIFKPCITKDLLQLYLDYGEDVNHTNGFLNTMLHVHTNPEIILCLLKNGIDLPSRNIMNDTAYIYHLKRNNLFICDLIRDYYSSTLIQRNWKIFWFKKTYIPLKNYKKKKELINYIELLPPSECGKFPGGIVYQDSLNDFIPRLLL